ncbi:hypothetical protein NDU88_005350 [Pleurodeles waltl]|uniref:Uncharacterized protein n=1 Tax=Pleurodeles waltl TaxID=8319 RepID=A0AAV7TAR2_PLEWA|nr:hypothetical protein NDU88_005350 [Pleurodeles waltl]
MSGASTGTTAGVAADGVSIAQDQPGGAMEVRTRLIVRGDGVPTLLRTCLTCIERCPAPLRPAAAPVLCGCSRWPAPAVPGFQVGRRAAHAWAAAVQWGGFLWDREPHLA